MTTEPVYSAWGDPKTDVKMSSATGGVQPAPNSYIPFDADGVLLGGDADPSETHSDLSETHSEPDAEIVDPLEDIFEDPHQEDSRPLPTYPEVRPPGRAKHCKAKNDTCMGWAMADSDFCPGHGGKLGKRAEPKRMWDEG